MARHCTDRAGACFHFDVLDVIPGEEAGETEGLSSEPGVAAEPRRVPPIEPLAV